MKKIAYLLLFLLAICGVIPAYAGPVIAISASAKQETVSFSLPQLAPHKVFRMASPNRLVVDVPTMPAGEKASLPGAYRGAFITGLRYGQFDPKTVRFVFALSQPVHVADVRQEEGKLIIVIEPLGATATKHADALPVIVIDPGHGGIDPGTIGPDGTDEKNVVLEFAKALRAHLLKSGHYKVLLTRDDDRFIILRQRFEIARKAHATLFISLHADSDPDGEARGLSVYTLSEEASDKEAGALAARENKADVLAGVNLSHERSDVASILISLAQRETANNSITLASDIVSALDGKVTLLPHSHRSAGFAVLKAPDVPSILIETGFLSQPQEEKLLKSKAYREIVVTGISSGIDNYFSQQKLAGVK